MNSLTNKYKKSDTKSSYTATLIKSKPYTKIGIVLFLILIIIFPSSSFEGAKQGLLLWFNTVLPTLLPFIIISNLIIKMQITAALSKLLYPLFHFLFGVSKEGCYPVLIGFLSGIPVGAKSVSDLLLNKRITTKEGAFLLGFCNNASPMFIMSYIAISQLKLPQMRLAILIILYLSAILSSKLYFKVFNNLKYIVKNSNEVTALSLYEEEITKTKSEKFDFALLDASIMNGFEIITKVGGYIILFSIPAKIIMNLFPSENILKLFTIGLLEITTGINQISSSSYPLYTKIVLVIILTAFGGLSGLAQTKSVINETRLSIFTYVKVKLLNMLIAFIFTILYLYIFNII
jgi:sporulation integral membrane protein YlbJ